MSALPILPVPLATPLTGAERVDEVALGRLVDHVVCRGADGLLVLGTTGEFAGLPDCERVRAVEAVVAAAAGRVPVWAGVGDASTARAAANMRALAGLDVDAYVVCAPYYMGSLSQLELERHFARLAEWTLRPLLVYNIPQTTGVTIEPETIARLAAYEEIIGAKDSAADFARCQSLLHLTAERPDFTVYTGQERLAAASLLAGAHGVVSGLANLVPEVFLELHAACRDERLDRAGSLQRWLTQLSDAISDDWWLRGIKHALDMQGVAQPRVLWPWVSDLAPVHREGIERLLDSTPVATWRP